MLEDGGVKLRLWIDDLRPAPRGYTWVKSVNEAKRVIEEQEALVQVRLDSIRDMESPMRRALADHLDTEMVNMYINLIDIDHDAGDYAYDGGDYIKLLDWLEATGRNYPIHIHSQNVVGVQNMRAIIQHNNWIEVR